MIVAFVSLVNDFVTLTIAAFSIQDLVLLPGIIKTELLRGTKNKKEYNQLNQMLTGLTYLAVDEDFWERLSNFSFQLFRKGITVPLTDTYIALLCIENQASLLHRDKHFDMIARETKLICSKLT